MSSIGDPSHVHLCVENTSACVPYRECADAACVVSDAGGWSQNLYADQICDGCRGMLTLRALGELIWYEASHRLRISGRTPARYGVWAECVRRLDADNEDET